MAISPRCVQAHLLRELTFLSPDEDELMSSINQMLPFPNEVFLRYVAEHRPQCLERAFFSLRVTGRWDQEAKRYEEEIRALLLFYQRLDRGGSLYPIGVLPLRRARPARA